MIFLLLTGGNSLSGSSDCQGVQYIGLKKAGSLIVITRMFEV